MFAIGRETGSAPPKGKFGSRDGFGCGRCGAGDRCRGQFRRLSRGIGGGGAGLLETQLCLLFWGGNPDRDHHAHRLGVTGVKLFPASQLGGVGFLKAVKAVYPQIPIMPTGGINPEQADDYFAAGAFAVGMGGVFSKEPVVKSDLIAAVKLIKGGREFPANQPLSLPDSLAPKLAIMTRIRVFCHSPQGCLVRGQPQTGNLPS